MAVYKVHVKQDAGGVVYSTNGTTLARVEGVRVSHPAGEERASSEEEAHRIARESITRMFHKLGVRPEFTEK